MSLTTNDGRALWTVWIAIAICLIGLRLLRAQAPEKEGSACTMRLIESPKAVYPELREKQTLRSAVVVDLAVNEDGTISHAHLSRSCGIQAYDRAVLKAVKKWRYNATTGCGERHTQITVNIHPK